MANGGRFFEARRFEARFVAFGLGCLFWSCVWDSWLPEAVGFEYILVFRGGANLHVGHVWLALRVC